MFTGIISDVGRLLSAERQNDGILLRMATAYDPESIDLGASIAHDGICLTVTARGTEADQHWFETFAGAETLAVTELGDWQAGRRVNLERALKMGDELGGHMVTGHVDGLAKIVSADRQNDQFTLWFDAPAALAPFIAKKGSVALNGTSLTVNDVAETKFSVHLIPHTLSETNWGERKTGERVNIEIDPMARYAARLIETSGSRS